VNSRWNALSITASAPSLVKPPEHCLGALDDRPRPGREPSITLEAKAWLTSLSCRKAKELGYPHELWTTRLLARHAREHGPAEGHPCLANLAQGTLCKILDSEEVKPHLAASGVQAISPGAAALMMAKRRGERNRVTTRSGRSAGHIVRRQVLWDSPERHPHHPHHPRCKDFVR
jgi:hypothetical protein